jgi:hypothetical protein
MFLSSVVSLALAVAPQANAKPIVRNEQVSVWDVSWMDGQASTWDTDTLLVFLTGGALDVTGPDGIAHRVARKTAEVEFVPKGMTVLRPGASKEPVRTIVIQLEGKSPPPLPNTAGVKGAFDRPGIEKIFDNDEVTAWRYTWELGKRTPLHFHDRDVVVVYFADGVLKSSTPDGKSVLNPNSFGFTKFSPRGRVHYEELVEGKSSAVMVELK